MSDPNPSHVGIMLVLFISTTLVYAVRRLRSGTRRDRDEEREQGVMILRQREDEYVMPFDVVYEGFGLESGLFR
jgi:hypothetical protein